MKIEDFIDLDGSFEQGKSNIILTGKKAVDNQIFNLFTTTSISSDAGTGERIFEPTYGGNLEQFLFYPFDVQVLELRHIFPKMMPIQTLGLEPWYRSIV